MLIVFTCVSVLCLNYCLASYAHDKELIISQKNRNIDCVILQSKVMDQQLHTVEFRTLNRPKLPRLYEHQSLFAFILRPVSL